MNPVQHILAHWFVDPGDAAAQPLNSAGSFSGAQLWRVAHRQRDYVLRRWPEAVARDRIECSHALQRHLANCQLPTPAPVVSLVARQTIVDADDDWWELAPWMPGEADYWRDPRPEKLDAALRMLAQIHVAAERGTMPPPGELTPHGIAPGLVHRQERLYALLLGETQELARAAEYAVLPVERQLIAEAVQLIQQALPAVVDKALPWRDWPLPLQWRLGDIWHDHVLFTGARVTGIIDFGAVMYDSPAGDVARLLGSLVADDRAAWRRGLDAYESVRPTSEAERAAVDVYDASGTVVSAARWIQWLWPSPGAEPPTIRNRAAALARLARLVERLRALAHRRG